MGRDAELLLRSALALPQAERSEIAGRLLESLEPPPETSVEEAWRQEVAARVAALDAGEVETVPWDEVRDRLFEKDLIEVVAVAHDKRRPGYWHGR